MVWIGGKNFRTSKVFEDGRLKTDLWGDLLCDVIALIVVLFL